MFFVLGPVLGGGFGEALGRLWGSFGDALGRLWAGFGEALGRLSGAVGRLWESGEALVRLWEALGNIWGDFGRLLRATVRPSARPTDRLYKISPLPNSRSSSSAGPY